MAIDPTFALFRILGNDLPPRHRVGQTYDNVAFILEHEPRFEGCHKRWVLNRIADPDEHARLVALLKKHGQTTIDIPFVIDDYSRCRHDHIDDASVFRASPTPAERERHNKILYATNCNGARNTALRAGHRLATWVLPLDGCCCFTSEGWRELADSLAAAPALDVCRTIPMYRLVENGDYHDFSRAERREAESQLVFGRDCPLSFDERYRYGNKSKVELLHRLGRRVVDTGYGAHLDDPSARCGHVLRLASGVPSGDATFRARIPLREQALDALLARLDAWADGRSPTAARRDAGAT